VSVVVVLVLAATMAALPAVAGGETDEGNPKNGFGAVTSQKASGTPDVGKHASDQEEPRQGVGNVARNDPAPGDHPGDHGCFIGKPMATRTPIATKSLDAEANVIP
jgi:hypothetical protein